jgi:RNA polymerase II-associated protein 1
MLRGQKFEIDLGSDDEQDAAPKQASAALPAAFVGDVLERQPKPPSAPTLKSKSGFPEHKKRPVQGRFKQQKTQASPINQTASTESIPDGASATSNTSVAPGGDTAPKSWEEEERQRIDQENRQKLAGMSANEIEAEREELMSSLSPALLQRLLKRSNIESGSNETDLSRADLPPSPAKPKPGASKSVTFADPKATDEDGGEDGSSAERMPGPPAQEDGDAPANQVLPQGSIHFPRPPQPPDLDPSSETFLEDLHDKYFPSLPADPDKLEWMQSSKSTKNSYDPSATAFHAKDIRFSFTGELLGPKTAAQIPVTAGLHHHGDSPDAAGYTIAELAHLSRSVYPAQRCIAFQTLGRILYRLGKGEFGDPGEPDYNDVPGVEAEASFGELARGLWYEVEQENVIETLVLESEGQGVDRGKHLSAKNYATEAVWLWRKGGGRRWKAS